MEAKIKYPIYRKYPHNRTFFKVLSPDEFEELQLLGKKYSVSKIKAKILPDRNFIFDLTFDYKNNWLEIQAAEYEKQLRFCEQNLTFFD